MPTRADQIIPTNVNAKQPLRPTIRYGADPSRTRPQRIVLINPPSIISRYAITELVPPIGLAYLGAVLRQAGHQVQIIDAIGESPIRPVPYKMNGLEMIRRGISFEEIVDKIGDRPDMIGVSGMFSNQWPHLKVLIQTLRAAYPAVPIIGGGEHFSAMPDLCLNTCPELDLCVLGEGEWALLDLIESRANGKDLDQVKGTAFRQNGRIVKTPMPGRIANIDEIPLPAWDLIPIENYLSNGLGLGVGKRRAMPMIATRGCPFQCTFCSSAFMWTTRWTPRDPQKVLDEIELYIKTFNAEEIQFYDLTAIIKKDWIIAFCKGIVERGIKIVWQLPIGTRSEVVDAEVADWLFRSGCRNMAFAPESGAPSVLKKIKKRVDLENMKQSMRACIKRGLNVKVNIILGFPKDTHLEVWESIKFAVENAWIGVHDLSFYPYAPYPGTELFDEMVREGRLKDFSDEWFLTLSFGKLAEFKSHCDHMSSKTLIFYQFFGFFTFYACQYLFRPQRLLRTLTNLVTGRQESKGEMAIQSILDRVNITKTPTASPK